MVHMSPEDLNCTDLKSVYVNQVGLYEIIMPSKNPNEKRLAIAHYDAHMSFALRSPVTQSHSSTKTIPSRD